MRSLLGRRLANSVNSVGSMILFLLFAVCSLIIVAAGVSTYTRISDNYRNTFSSSAAVRYVTNKIRGADSVVLSEDWTGLTVYNGESACVIMNTDTGIAEKTIRSSAQVDYTGGDIIFPHVRLIVEDNADGTYSITVNSGKESYSALCRSKATGVTDG